MSLSDNIIKAKNVKITKGKIGDSPRGSATEGRGKAAANKPPFPGSDKGRVDYSQIVDKVKKESYEKGFAQGLESRKKEMAAALKAISLTLAEIKRLKKDFYADIEDRMLDLVFSVTRKVINMEVSTNREVVLSVLREAVKKISDVNGIKILLNPDDLSFIMEMKQDLFRENSLFKDAVFAGSSTVERGGFLLETDNFELDARLEQRFAIVEEAFKNR
jgi:flagellar assembly protein FliH